MDIAPDFDFIVIPLPVWTFHGSKASHPAVGLMNGVGDEVPFGVESTGSYGGGLLSAIRRSGMCALYCGV